MRGTNLVTHDEGFERSRTLAKEAVASKGSTKQAERKTIRKLKKIQTAFRKSERKVSKLRVRLERAESKLAVRVQRLSELELQLQPAEESEPVESPHGIPVGVTADGQTATSREGSDDPVIAYTPLAGSNGTPKQLSARGKKGGRNR
jgi:hypothetical protein